MKLPKRWIGTQKSLSRAGRVEACELPQRDKPSGYRILTCTTNLGATDQRIGHPALKHCFAKIENPQGEVIQTLSYGYNGVGPESNTVVPSVRCEVQAAHLSAQEAEQFVREYERYGVYPYQWGSNDCCSLLVKATHAALRTPAPFHIRKSAHDIQNSPEVRL